MTDKSADGTKETRLGRFLLTRRAFLKATAFIGMASAAFNLLKLPFGGRSATAAEGVVTEKRVNTSCLNCDTRCATRVRVVNGRAVKIDGNPFSEISEGKICPRGLVGLQVLYDPARVSGPLKRTNPAKGTGIDPRWTPISWEEALQEISGRLGALRDRGNPHQLLLMHGLNAKSDEDLISRFAEAYGTPNLVSGSTLENEAEKVGRWLADGRSEHIGYDFGKSDYILSFGAGIIESEKPLARNLRLWGKIKRERPNRAGIVVIDPRYSVTAARADRWLPINPGTDAALALAIANVIISEGLYDAAFIEKYTQGLDEYKALVLRDYSPQKAAAITGIDAATIRQLARDFANARPAIAWAGARAAGSTNGSYTAYAIFCLNALVGSIDTPGGVIYQEDPPYRQMPEVALDSTARAGMTVQKLDLRRTRSFPAAGDVANQLADSIINSSPYRVEAALGFNCNFSFTAPGTGRWNEALARIPFYVHVSPFISEMAEYADILMPATNFLEQWGYDHSPPGSGFAEAKLKQPVVESSHDSRSPADIIFGLAAALGGTVDSSFSGIGGDAEGFVKYRTGNLISWSELLDKGVWRGTDYKYYKYDSIFDTPSGKFEFRSGNLEKLEKGRDPLAYLPHYEEPRIAGDARTYPLILSPYQPVLNIENGGQNYPWAQEVYLVMHGMGWDNYAEISRDVAGAAGIRDRDYIWVESPSNKIKVRARVIEGILPGVAAMATGQGHYAAGQFQKGIGVNPNDIIGVDYDRLSGQSAFYNTRVRIYRA